PADFRVRVWLIAGAIPVRRSPPSPDRRAFVGDRTGAPVRGALVSVECTSSGSTDEIQLPPGMARAARGGAHRRRGDDRRARPGADPWECAGAAGGELIDTVAGPACG